VSLGPALRYLRDYIAIPSVNPMGRDDQPAEIVGERRYGEHVRAQLRAAGLDAELIGSAERPSVVAVARASEPDADTVLIASHLDTVPVDNMEIDPFDPEVANGRIYGRGSCDTKGGLAAAVAALERVLSRGKLMRNVILVGEADEELSSLGVIDVLERLERAGSEWPAVDWVLATEPTELKIVTHHKGIAVARLEARGRACHSSDPSAGESAIVELSRAVLALEDLAATLAERLDPVLGHGTLSVGLMGGGQAPNIVPDGAWLLMDRRLVPGDTEVSVRSEIEGALASHGIHQVEVVACHVEKPALAIDSAHPAVQHCRSALVASGRAAELATVAFGTDAGVFAERGLPGVVMGPGSIAQAHTSREFVEVAQVEAMTDFFEGLFRNR